MTLPTLPLSRRARTAQLPAISDLMKRALQNPNLVSLAAGFVDNQTLPCAEVKEAIDQIWNETTSAAQALQYGTTAGYEPLRQTLLDRWTAEEPSAANVQLDQVILTAGSNQLLQLVTQAIVDEGDIVLCAAPTYFVYTGLLEFLGIRTVGIACDEFGIVPSALEATVEALEQAGEGDRVKLLYVVSYCDNPRGITMPASRRRELMNCIDRLRPRRPLRVIDDCAYQSLDLSTDDPVYSLRHYTKEPDAVIVAGTFSKSFSPGIRVGWGIVPPDLVVPVLEQKGHIDFGSAHLNQHLMQRVLQLGLWDQQVERLRETYRSKLATTLEALAATSLASTPGVRWTVPHGGLYVWLELPSWMATGSLPIAESAQQRVDSELLTAAIDRGVLYVPGEYCYPTEGETGLNDVGFNCSLRLSFGVTTESEIERGISSLADAVESCLATAPDGNRTG